MDGAAQQERGFGSFRQVYDEHVDFVWRSLARLGVGQTELEDAVQEVFLVVHRRLGDFEGRSKLTTWLFRICFHIARDRRRRAYRRHEVLFDAAIAEQVDTRMDAEASLLQRDDLALFERSLSSMSYDQRAVFVLFELEEFSCEEIASSLEIPLGTVYSRLRRARELFQRSISVARASEVRGLLREGA